MSDRRTRTLDADPLIEVVERRGGYGKIAPEPWPDYVPTPERRAYYRARSLGVVSAYHAEHFCNLLDLHPVELWGQDYYDAEYRPWGRNDSECEVRGCQRDARCRGWCSRHYSQWQRGVGPVPVGCADCGDRHKSVREALTCDGFAA